MIQKLKKLSLEQQLFISFLSLSCFLLLFSLSIAFIFSSTWKRKDIDSSLKATASYIASMDQIASMLQLGYPDESGGNWISFQKISRISISSPYIIRKASGSTIRTAI